VANNRRLVGDAADALTNRQIVRLPVDMALFTGRDDGSSMGHFHGRQRFTLTVNARCLDEPCSRASKASPVDTSVVNTSTVNVDLLHSASS